MKKENNQEFYVEQMDVHYPLQSEIQNEIEDIILKGMPQKISFLKRMKKIPFQRQKSTSAERKINLSQTIFQSQPNDFSFCGRIFYGFKSL